MPSRRSKDQPQKPKNSSSVRIIGGQWRSRKLPVLQAEGLRPTGDRIRETLFNWLATEIVGLRCLDLFAGSGALGLEALSRGAASCQFIEYDRRSANQLQANLALLGASPERGRVHCDDAITWLYRDHQTITDQFDLVFVDPPFAKQLWQPALSAVRHHLSTDALIYVEHPLGAEIDDAIPGERIKHKNAGQVSYGLYRIGREQVD